MIIEIYLVCFFVVTMWSIYCYVKNEKLYRFEMIRIRKLEERISRRNKRRDTTVTCPYEFNDPRSCFLGSNYKCHWDEVAERCNVRQ